MTLPRISIVTPSYNQGHFLEQTILSVLNQGYENLEYIIVDGGSTDHSRRIIEQYADRLAWWVSEKDRGQSHAINKGLRRSTGSILTWLNSDDVLCPGALARMAEFFTARPECGVAMGDMEIIDARGRVVDERKAVPVTLNTILYSACAVPQPAAMFTRSAWELAGDVDERLHYQMDFEYFLRMRAKGARFGVIRQPITQFRLHGDSKTVSRYDTLVWDANRRIQDQFLGWNGRTRVHAAYMSFQKWRYRAFIYLMRAALRGSAVPFRNSRARRRAAQQPSCA